ncbi:hypothetical protein PT974_10861 [Cladobotryum mycophilum]|uniref:Uncharacterized protein n=1 Tax=Cladobotryum mycophilum TaxID=491253 RepID=A0ABR0SB36_9HYPO
MTDWHVQCRETTEHLYGNGLWMLPGHQTRGGAELLVRTMTSLVDKLYLDVFAETATMSKPLLFRCGFNLLATMTPTVQCDSTDEEIKRLVQDLNSNPIAITMPSVDATVAIEGGNLFLIFNADGTQYSFSGHAAPDDLKIADKRVTLTYLSTDELKGIRSIRGTIGPDFHLDLDEGVAVTGKSLYADYSHTEIDVAGSGMWRRW